MGKTIRGTTPTVIFNLPFNVSMIKNCEVYFAQNDEVLFMKGYNDCVFADTAMQVTLQQKDTLLLDDGEKLQIQIRFRFTDDSVDATEIIKDKVGKLLSDEPIYSRRKDAEEAEPDVD